ncbi:hypothetical protein N9773_00480 [Flavobacteriaceae bacterium]|nr:hypothetical protein [Flavobacteriaceae bacterium]
MRINWNIIKGLFLLGLVVFLYAFSSFKNNGRSVSKVAVQFTGNDNVYITTEMVNKLLIQNQEQLYILPKDNLDLKEMEFLLESDDMIKSAQVYLTVNGEVRAKVEQKRPIARVHAEATFYIDEDGLWMPLSPQHSARVPLITGVVDKEDLNGVYTLALKIFKDSFLKTYITEIKAIEVDFEELDLEVAEDDFIINEVTTMQVEDDNFEAIPKDQTMLSFDLPISNKTSVSESDTVEVFTLEDSNETTVEAAIKEIEVNDYIELIPVTEANETGETRYALDDHIVLQQTDQKYEGKKQAVNVDVEEEMVLSKVTVKERTVTSVPEENVDPFNNPISKTLRDRADERRQKMKAFNYKFNTSKIEEIEKEPAYKRQGVNLNDVAHSSDVQSSRTTIGLDDNDEVQLRSNNSYLHDNVD